MFFIDARTCLFEMKIVSRKGAKSFNHLLTVEIMQNILSKRPYGSRGYSVDIMICTAEQCVLIGQFKSDWQVLFTSELPKRRNRA